MADGRGQVAVSMMRFALRTAALLLLSLPALAQQCGGSVAQGNETAGGSTRTLDNTARGHQLTLASDVQAGTFQVCAYISDSATGDSFQAAVVSTSDGTTILAESSVRTDISTAGWYAFTGDDFTTYAPTATTTVYVVVGSTSAASASAYWDAPGLTSGAAASGGITGVNPFTITAPGVQADSTRDYSLHIEYTVAGGGCPVCIIQQHGLQRLGRGHGPSASARLGGVLH